MNNKTIKIILLIGLTTPSFGQTFTLDFNTDQNGNTILAGDAQLAPADQTPDNNGFDLEALQPYDGIYGNGLGIAFESVSGETLTVYNTDIFGLDGVGRDDDLEPDYEGGNNDASVSFGNALILQTSSGDQANNIDDPNDNGSGGIYTITSDLGLVEFSFVVLDIDNAVDAELRFADTATGEFVDVFFENFEDANSVFFVQDVEVGDRHSNTIDSVTIENLQSINSALTSFDQITFTATTSGAVGEITVTTVPEPSSTLLSGLGLVALAFRRKR